MTNTELKQLRENIIQYTEEFMDSYIQGDPTPEERIKLLQDYNNELLALFQSHEAQIKQDIFKKVEGILTEGIDKEIDWCKNAPDENITEEDRLSFIEGLIQANRIIYKVLKALEEEELK